MAITLIVEDGTGKADANTFVDLTEAATIAEQDARMAAYVDAADDDARALALTTAFAWLDRFEGRLAGDRTDDQQAGIFPRLIRHPHQWRHAGCPTQAEVPIRVTRAQLLAASAHLAGRPLDGVPAAGAGVVTAIRTARGGGVDFDSGTGRAGDDAANPAPAAIRELEVYFRPVRGGA